MEVAEKKGKRQLWKKLTNETTSLGHEILLLCSWVG